MRLFELISFTLRIRTPAQALPRLRLALEMVGEGVSLMGCWVSEIGLQNRIAALRGFVDADSCQRRSVSSG